MQNFKKFLPLLICVDCGGFLKLSGRAKIFCVKCRRQFLVVDGIPIFLPSETGKKQSNQIVNQQQIFNKEYEEINRYRLENWRHSMLHRIFSALDMKEKRKGYFGDFGIGGTGYTVIEAAKLGYFCVGTDISLTGVSCARLLAKNQKVADKIFFAVATAERLPFRAGSFKIACSISVLEHLQKDRQAIGELCRVTKEKIFTVVPNTYQKIWFFLWPVYWFADWKVGHLRHYSAKQLSLMFTLEGWSLVKVFYNGHMVKFLQLGLEKILGNKFPERIWWRLEEKDLENNSASGLQLNMLFLKK